MAGTDNDLDLYKFYLGLVLKIGVFIFGVSGAIVSYVLANAPSSTSVIFAALVLPFLLNAIFSIFCLKFIPAAQYLAEAHTSDAPRYYDLRPLVILLRVFGIIYALVAVGIVLLAGVLLAAGFPTLGQ